MGLKKKILAHRWVVYLWHRWCRRRCIRSSRERRAQCRRTGSCEVARPACRRPPALQRLAASIPADIWCVDTAGRSAVPTSGPPTLFLHRAVAVHAVRMGFLVHHHHQHHLFQYLLSPPSAASQCYNLRRRPHTQLLPKHHGHLMNSNFITRTLYKNIYWRYYETIYTYTESMTNWFHWL